MTIENELSRIASALEKIAGGKVEVPVPPVATITRETRYIDEGEVIIIGEDEVVEDVNFIGAIGDWERDPQWPEYPRIQQMVSAGDVTANRNMAKGQVKVYGTLKDCVVGRLAGGPQDAAVQLLGKGKMFDCAVSNVGGIGIEVRGDVNWIRDCTVKDARWLGIGGPGKVLIEDTTVENCGIEGGWMWQSGGIKLTGAAGVYGSEVRDCDGPGIWFDVHADNSAARENLIERCLGHGLFAELSKGIRLSDNFVHSTRSGSVPDSPTDPEFNRSQIRVANVYGCKVIDNYAIGHNPYVLEGTDREVKLGNVEHRGNVFVSTSTHDRRVGDGWPNTVDWMGADVNEHNTVSEDSNPDIDNLIAEWRVR